MRLEKEYVVHEDVLCIADVHLGLQISSGLGPPMVKDQRKKKKISNIIEKEKPETVVFNGDTFHYSNPSPESKRVIEDIYNETSANIVFLTGNHDDEEILQNVAAYGEIDTSYKVNDVFFTHGHKEVDENYETVVIGHLHPVKKNKNEHNKCYLRSTDKEVYVLPALTEKERTISNLEMISKTPYLKNKEVEYMIPSSGKWKSLSSKNYQGDI